jgi:hypothetical protein
MDKQAIVISNARRRVDEPITRYEARWALSSLARVDKDLYDRLIDQMAKFYRAINAGKLTAIQVHSEAAVKGWEAAIRRMESSELGGSSYMIGQCRKSGKKVAIGYQKAASRQVRIDHGESVVLFSPDEIAEMLVGTREFRIVEETKKRFPGAEISDVRDPISLGLPHVELEETFFPESLTSDEDGAPSPSVD